MKKTTKNILGLAGLATVAALTIIASGISTPANAVNGDIELNYNVLDSGRTSQIIASPGHEMKTASNVIPVKVLYSDTTTIKYSLTYTDDSGQTQTIELPSYDTPEYSGGVHAWELNLDDYNLGYGTYVLHVDVYGNGTSSDSVEFSYQPVTLESVSPVDENGNAPTADDGTLDLRLDVSIKESPSRGEIQVYNPDGTPAIDSATGQPIIISLSQEDIASGLIHLDLSSFGLENGKVYTLTARVYDADGELIGFDSVTVLYSVASIDVPNTGGSVFSTLNLSSSDFLASGLITFFAISLIALVAVKKSGKEKTRQR